MYFMDEDDPFSSDRRQPDLHRGSQAVIVFDEYAVAQGLGVVNLSSPPMSSPMRWREAAIYNDGIHEKRRLISRLSFLPVMILVFAQGTQAPCAQRSH